MKPLIKISDTIIQRLLKTKTECRGKLYGTFFKNTLIVVGLQVDLTDSPINLVDAYPAEVDFCGIFVVTNNLLDQTSLCKSVEGIDVTDNPVLIQCKLGGAKNEIRINVVINEKLEEVKFNVIKEQEVSSQYVFVRLNGRIPMVCEAEAQAIEETFAKIRKDVTSGALGFSFPFSNVCLLGNEYESSLSKDRTVEEFCEGIAEETNKRKKNNHELQVVNIDLLRRTTREGDEQDLKEHGPVCVFNKKQLEALNIPINIDFLSMVHRQTKLTRLYEILVESVVRFLKLYDLEFLSKVKNSTEGISKSETYHFYPEGCGHFLTRIYMEGQNDETLLPQRQVLHDELLLNDVTTPLFRRANAYQFRNPKEKVDGPLIKPHGGLKTTESADQQISLVKGRYEYYHYCQNKMDDNGWGCAYRSLQTLASWFVLQGFTQKVVPTFKEIQKCLVDIGDKPASFIGSRQWIGSTEVNFVLNTLLGVESKIKFVSSGEEMSTVGPELVFHFQHHGSPIMIGGGVLAHTILGVDYNQITGRLMFLILDPHYTGGEDLGTILSKGWCGWKGVDFWDKKAHYNMCMPQVPREI